MPQLSSMANIGSSQGNGCSAVSQRGSRGVPRGTAPLAPAVSSDIPNPPASRRAHCRP